MASDGLRSNGLDKATINKIHQRASKSGATVQIWWGRHTPYSKPYDDTDKRGRKEAKSRLSELRNLANKEKRWKLIPRYYVEPMETHAKLFIIDDYRLMITSDNTLSFGDTESERGDAGELGMMIDHMRLPIQTRGSMELWLPKEAKISGDSVRWWALLGEEVTASTEYSSQRISLIDTLDSMIERIESNENLSVAWEQEMDETNSDEITILNRLAKGSNFGMYSISRSKEKFWMKISKFDENETTKTQAIISLSSNRWKNSSKPKEKKPKYFCPTCNTLLNTWKKAKLHKKETGHGCCVCDDCGELFIQEKFVKAHKDETGHLNYSGQFFGQAKMKIKKK